MQVSELKRKKDFLFQEINGKPVYIFEDHATAVIPWLMIKEKIGVQPHLITLDHHTDTMDAFRFYYGCLSLKRVNEEEIDLRINDIMIRLKKLVKNYEYDEIEPLLNELRFDEQIDLSIKLGILNYSITLPSSQEGESPTDSDRVKKYHQDLKDFWNQRNGYSRTEKFNLTEPIYPYEDGINLIKSYSMPENKIFIIDSKIKCDCLSSDEEDQCRHNYNSYVIDDRFLHNQIGLASNMTITAMGKLVTDGPYILDIDLDYFHNTKSIQPEKYECFYALIRNAVAITIARESSCVLMCKEDTEDENYFNSNFLQSKLLEHIYNATNQKEIDF